MENVEKDKGIRRRKLQFIVSRHEDEGTSSAFMREWHSRQVTSSE